MCCKKGAVYCVPAQWPDASTTHMINRCKVISNHMEEAIAALCPADHADHIHMAVSSHAHAYLHAAAAPGPGGP